VVELEMTPDSQSGSCGFKSRRGFHRIEVRLAAPSHGDFDRTAV
jgi:hypothetical protein